MADRIFNREHKKPGSVYVSYQKNPTVYKFIETISPKILVTNNIGEFNELNSTVLVLDTNEIGAVRITSDEKVLVLH